MKKLIMAVAIVCAAVASHAAQIAWGNTSYSKITDLTGAYMSKTYYTALTVSLLDASGTAVASTTTMGMTAGILTGDGLTYTYTYGTDAGQYSQGDTFSILAKMTVDGKDYEMSFGSFSIAATDNTGKDTFTWESGTYGGLSGTATAGSVAAWSAQSVPEPTSGLLLVLGMAGLALRRRRA